MFALGRRIIGVVKIHGAYSVCACLDISAIVVGGQYSNVGLQGYGVAEQPAGRNGVGEGSTMKYHDDLGLVELIGAGEFHLGTR